MTVDDGGTRRETRPHAPMDPPGEVNTDTEGMEEDVHTAQDVSELEDVRGESTTTHRKTIELKYKYKAALEKERAHNAELQKQIEEMVGNRSGGQNTNTKPIPRPGGTAGTDFSIQEAMGLSGSTKKYETYKAIQVC